LGTIARPEPDVKGDVLVAELRARRPDLPIVVASGYDDPDIRRRFAHDGHITFMRKPYTQADLKRAMPPVQNG